MNSVGENFPEKENSLTSVEGQTCWKAHRRLSCGSKFDSQRNSAPSVSTRFVLHLHAFPKNEFIFHRVCQGQPGELQGFYGKMEALSSSAPSPSVTGSFRTSRCDRQANSHFHLDSDSEVGQKGYRGLFRWWGWGCEGASTPGAGLLLQTQEVYPRCVWGEGVEAGWENDQPKLLLFPVQSSPGRTRTHFLLLLSSVSRARPPCSGIREIRLTDLGSCGFSFSSSQNTLPRVRAIVHLPR